MEKLNRVLVHGAWGDGSYGRHIMPILDQPGYAMRAVPIPLKSLADNTAWTMNRVHALTRPALLASSVGR